MCEGRQIVINRNGRRRDERKHIRFLRVKENIVYELIVFCQWHLQARDGEKRSPFDGMDRDQLVKKCKGLLGIAQAAKKAKDGEFKRHMTSYPHYISMLFLQSSRLRMAI